MHRALLLQLLLLSSTASGEAPETLFTAPAGWFGWYIRISRSGHLVTAVGDASGRPSLLMVPSASPPQLFAPPQGVRFLGVYEASDWGAVLMADSGGSPPVSIHAAPVGGELQEILRKEGGDFSAVTLDDAGLIVAIGRDSAQELPHQVWWSRSGEAPLQLPDLGQELAALPFFDGLGRLLVFHLLPGEGNLRQLFRYQEGSGWTRMLEAHGDADDPDRILDVHAVNSRGDILYTAFTQGAHQTIKTSLYLYTDENGVSERLLDVTGAFPRFSDIERALLSDKGDVLVALSNGLQQAELRLRWRRRGEEFVDLRTLLSASDRPLARPAFDLSAAGELLLEVEEAPATFAYRIFGPTGDRVALAGQTQRVFHGRLDAAGAFYFWRIEPDRTQALLRVAPPAPPAPRWRPADIDGDAAVGLVDAIALLEILFSRTELPLPCGDDAAARTILDINADARVDIADPAYLILALFLGGPAPPGGTECRTVPECQSSSACAASGSPRP